MKNRVCWFWLPWLKPIQRLVTFICSILADDVDKINKGYEGKRDPEMVNLPQKDCIFYVNFGEGDAIYHIQEISFGEFYITNHININFMEVSIKTLVKKANNGEL